MKFDAIRLHDAALTLENEALFYRRYNEAAPKYGAAYRRDLIARFLASVGINGHDAEDREHLRRYFDHTYGIVDVLTDVLPGVPTLEFWRDEVKYPPSLPPGLRKGAEFDVSFAKLPGANDRERWSRYGRIWGAQEVAQLKGLFWSGRNLEYICRAMERPPNGVLSKLAEHHCLTFDPTALKYLVRKKTPTNSNTSDAGIAPEPEPTTSPAEIAEHIDKAVSHLTRVSNSLKEILMNKTEIIKIETKTFLNGTDVNTMSPAHLFAHIQNVENEIRRLSTLVNQPKQVRDYVASLEKGLDSLMKAVDGEDAAYKPVTCSTEKANVEADTATPQG